MIVIDEKYARMILDMEYVCFSEGLGPDNKELIKEIFDEFPILLEEYHYLLTTYEKR